MSRDKQIEEITQYYVLRNKDTGMYFRGKGVNRWGKYFNQATIYRVKGTAEASVREVSWNGEKTEIVPIQIFENNAGYRKASEVEDWKEIAEGYQKMFEDSYEKHQSELREIFEEIEILLDLNSRQGDIFTGKYFDVDLKNDIAELKKKYTEGEKDNGN